MSKYFKELVLWTMIVLPYVYLATIWNELPEKVPTHFNIEGQANGWSSKTALLFIPGELSIGIYLLMLIIPALDPKRKIQQMGDKFYTFRFMITLFISLLVTYLLYLGKVGSLKDPNILIALIGALLAMSGNYFQTIRPNYFIGIRTPWTLENEQVWKRTHLLGGRIWMIGGVLIIIFSFIITNNHALIITFSTFLSIMVIIPVVFSYTEFRKERNILN